MLKNKMQAAADKITKVTLTNDDLHNLILYTEQLMTALDDIIWLCNSSPSIRSIEQIARAALSGKRLSPIPHVANDDDA